MKIRIGIGIIGAGLIAPAYLAGFQEIPEKAQVVAVSDIDRQKAEDLACLCGATVYPDYQQLIADPAVNLVVILLPHYLHYPAAMAVLRAQKHLVIEKPIAMTYAEAEEIYKTVRSSGVFFAVAENTRYIQAYCQAEKIIKAGKLGQITLVRTFLAANERTRLTSQDFWGKKARLGGGVLLDSGPHIFYLLKWLFGEIESLAAFTAHIYPTSTDIEDNADVRGHLACGAEFISSFSFTTEIPHNERLEVYGSSGSLIIDQLANPPAITYTDPTDYDGTPLQDVSFDPLGWHFFSIVEEAKDIVNSLENFIHNIDLYSNAQLTSVDPADCLYAMRIVEKAYESANQENKLIIIETKIQSSQECLP